MSRCQLVIVVSLLYDFVEQRPGKYTLFMMNPKFDMMIVAIKNFVTKVGFLAKQWNTVVCES